ncbi:hypothetical protein ASD37_16545 [Mycobacterium sp. Root135]|uniref:DUF732 domain-containing protein n=1 Tax=Mycobacterium sp. Root135 TaxID=1736457 RepID=UPI0006F705BF|nr:DUF732 domain-containing protein [Mycobacterium sp. Root135]KQY05973.1 hypothetical protein ASD37_16545 [Mycobacterium sp. Root135]
MKKMVLPIVAATIAVGLAGAGTAHADQDSYLSDLADNDFTGSTDIALQMGYTICTDVKHGVPEATTVTAIYENTADSVTEDDAVYIYEAALIHLC